MVCLWGLVVVSVEDDPGEAEDEDASECRIDVHGGSFDWIV